MMEVSPTAVVLKYVGSVPVDLNGMARELGLVVTYDPHLPGSIAGKLERDKTSPSGFRVTVNASDNTWRQRFTLAHEIAHFVLHRDLLTDGVVDNALYRSSLSDEYERDADRFAASIILPAEAVRRAYRTEQRLGPLADLFNVSGQAMRIRAKELRLGG